MFSNYPTSAIVIIAVLFITCIVLAYFVWRYYWEYQSSEAMLYSKKNLVKKYKKIYNELKDQQDK
jgi:regulatory protein YycH of two-component signal transduction system YycFG